jgi:hypothetical protein
VFSSAARDGIQSICVTTQARPCRGHERIDDSAISAFTTKVAKRQPQGNRLDPSNEPTSHEKPNEPETRRTLGDSDDHDRQTNLALGQALPLGLSVAATLEKATFLLQIVSNDGGSVATLVGQAWLHVRARQGRPSDRSLERPEVGVAEAR